MANSNDVLKAISDLRAHTDGRFDSFDERWDKKNDALHKRISDLRDDMQEEHKQDAEQLQEHEKECAKWKSKIESHVRIVQWVCGTAITALVIAWAQQFFN